MMRTGNTIAASTAAAPSSLPRLRIFNSTPEERAGLEPEGTSPAPILRTDSDSAQGGGDAVEDARTGVVRQARADEGDSSDDDHGDQTDHEAVLDGGGALIVLTAAPEGLDLGGDVGGEHVDHSYS